MVRFAVAGFACWLALFGVAQAEIWPERPITLVVPYAAGSPADTIGRLLAEQITGMLAQRVVIENMPGAGGTIGSARVAKAPPDGYLAVQGGTGTHAQSQTLYKTPPYDAANDFTPVALIGESPLVLVTRDDLPASDLKSFIAYARANPTTYGSAGVGLSTHLSCALLTGAAGFNATHVPYRGMGLVIQDITAGRVDFACDFVLDALPQVQAGNIKALAVLTKKRSEALANVPTADEQGLSGFDAYNWNAVFLPKATPEAITRKLNAALVQALDAPAIKDTFSKLGVVIPPSEHRTPEYLGAFVKSEIAKWSAPIKASGATAE
jgi:tripartite-type tricarboxylate transporter receptor subunit TctC